MAETGPIDPARLGPVMTFDPSSSALASALIVYILNVGDGDAIVIQFPTVGGRRSYALVDSFHGAKTIALLDTLGADRLEFICASHPHFDHIRGIPAVMGHMNGGGRGGVGAFWDSGFRFTSVTYRSIMQAVADAGIPFIRPTSGFETRVNNATVAVLSPSVHLRNRYDTHGIDVNNASIVLRLDYPSRSFVDDTLARAGDTPTPDLKTRSVILGGDAQTDAWSKVLEDYPHFTRVTGNFSQQIKERTRRQPLACDVFKVSHHASKRGINLELIERMGDTSGTGPSKGPRYMVSSCAHGAASSYGFPHPVIQEILREVRFPTATTGANRPADDELGIHFTSQLIDDGVPTPAGSVAVVLHENGAVPHLYRFQDAAGDPIDLGRARRALG